ncbi:MAG: NAD(P)/FAD-dependent oxidoreductase [Thermomicrobiales bacterium]
MTAAHTRSDTSGRHHVDILIAGGAVAGSALGAVLAREGYSVAIVEREPVFRDRIRGESIHPWGVKELRAIGLADTVIGGAHGVELSRWTRYRDGEQTDSFQWSDLMPGSPGEISVRHPAMQDALLAAATAAGADVHRPAHLVPRREGAAIVATIEADGRSIEVVPRLLVGADGQRSAIRTWIGGSGRRDPIHHAIAGAIVSGLHLDPDSAHQAYFPGGFAMVFPQAGGTNRIYYVCPTPEAERLQREDLPDALIAAMRPWLPAGAIGEWRSEGPAGFFPNADIVADITYAPGVVLIGDAAGANDPSQGHGLSLAFRDVRALRDLLAASDDWATVPERFATAQRNARETLRQHAIWSAPLMTEVGLDAEALHQRVAAARALDPSAGGFAPIFMSGPEGLVADEAARRHFLGEDLDEQELANAGAS